MGIRFGGWAQSHHCQKFNIGGFYKFGGSVRDRHIMYNIMQVQNLILADLNLKVDH